VQLRLDEVIVGDLRVSRTVEHDLDERLLVQAAPELGELRLDIRPDAVVHLTVPHRDPQSHHASSSRFEQTLSHGPSKAHDLDRACSRPPERAGTRRDGGTRGVDVVDEEDGRGRRARDGDERVPHVRPSLGTREPCLARSSTDPLESVLEGQAPELGERPSEPFRRHVAARPRSLPIAGHEGDGVDSRASDDLRDDRGQDLGKIATPPLLPGRDERPRAGVVDDGGPCPRESESATAALHAAPDGPRAWAPAAITHGWGDADEERATRIAERAARDAAGGAA